jgi:hypothetical protein
LLFSVRKLAGDVVDVEFCFVPEYALTLRQSVYLKVTMHLALLFFSLGGGFVDVEKQVLLTCHWMGLTVNSRRMAQRDCIMPLICLLPLFQPR